jgi:hypothetical protein
MTTPSDDKPRLIDEADTREQADKKRIMWENRMAMLGHEVHLTTGPVNSDMLDSGRHTSVADKWGVFCPADQIGSALRGRDVTLTAADPEPPAGTCVRDATGECWVHSDEGDYWLRVGREYGDPESWVKIAGNYGPVTVLE